MQYYPFLRGTPDCEKDSGKLLAAVTFVVACASLGPLLFPRIESWDFVQIELAFANQDHAYFGWMREWYYFRYLIALAVNELSLLLNVSAKSVFNVLSVLSILGLSREVFVFLNQRFGFSLLSSYAGAWATLAFPVWHTLASGAVFFYLLFFFAFMISLNLWWKKRYLLALPFFAFSMPYFSLFSLAVGFAFSEFCLTATRENYRDKALKTFIFCVTLTIAFLAIKSVMNIHQAGDYNTFNPRLLSFAAYGAVAAGTGLVVFFWSRRLDQRESEELVRLALSFLALAFFAGLAYWAVGRPLRFFAFGSYTARHTYLTCIPFAMLVAFGCERLLRAHRKKAAVYAVSFLTVLLVVLQHQGHSHKAAALAFREALTQSFQELGEPPSGYVSIVVEGAKPPRHVHPYEVNMSLYRAFGKDAWMANGFWANRGAVYDREMLENSYAGLNPEEKRSMIAGTADGDAFSKYRFTLSNYHQEGRFWYWWYYLASDYSAFDARLELIEVDE